MTWHIRLSIVLFALFALWVVSSKREDAVAWRPSLPGDLSTVAGTSVSPVCHQLANSRKYDPRCHGNATRLPLLITGVGGCGTHQMSGLMSSMGLDLPHEKPGKHGSVSWLYAVDSEHYCFYKSETLKCDGFYYYHKPRHTLGVYFDRVFHQTRCPMANIGSMSTHPVDVFNFTAPMVGENLRSVPKFLAAAKTYIAWSHYVETIADYRYQLETANITEIIERAGLLSSGRGREEAEALVQGMHKPDPKANLGHRVHRTFTLSSLRELDRTVADQVEELSVKYGYESCMEDCACNFDGVTF